MRKQLREISWWAEEKKMAERTKSSPPCLLASREVARR